MNMENIVQQVIKAVGGQGNISSCDHFMTRLHLTFNDNSSVDLVELKSINGVYGIVESEQQFQIILAPEKAQKLAEMLNRLVA